MQLPYANSLIIIPTYNEVDNVGKMISTLFSMYPDISLLIIDDGSPDGSAHVVKELMSHHKNLNSIVREKKLGLGSAYVLGFKWALDRSYEYIFEMDCDFSHDPKNIEDLLMAVKTCDLVIGSRYIGGIRIINWSLRRLLLSYCATMYTRVITGLPLYDPIGGFKCFSRKALEALDLNSVMSNGYGFQLEINYKIYSKGLSIKEIPIIFYERSQGKSKMGGNIITEAFFNVIALRIKKLFGTL